MPGIYMMEKRMQNSMKSPRSSLRLNLLVNRVVNLCFYINRLVTCPSTTMEKKDDCAYFTASVV